MATARTAVPGLEHEERFQDTSAADRIGEDRGLRASQHTEFAEEPGRQRLGKAPDDGHGSGALGRLHHDQGRRRDRPRPCGRGRRAGTANPSAHLAGSGARQTCPGWRCAATASNSARCRSPPKPVKSVRLGSTPASNCSVSSGSKRPSGRVIQGSHRVGRPRATAGRVAGTAPELSARVGAAPGGALHHRLAAERAGGSAQPRGDGRTCAAGLACGVGWRR